MASCFLQIVEFRRFFASNPSRRILMLFVRREQERQNDERHAQEMLDLLPRAFSFETGGTEGAWRRILYKPNPNYVPQTTKNGFCMECLEPCWSIVALSGSINSAGVWRVTLHSDMAF
jgi:hypothetical protein